MKIAFYINLLTVFFVFAVLPTAFGQDENKAVVRGLVLDVNKQPLEGVVISNQSSGNQSVTSDSKGAFFIASGSDEDIIVFKKRGYAARSLSFKELLSGEVLLNSTAIENGEEDDVYIAFGIRKKRAITSSIASIRGNALPQVPLGVLNNNLAGRLPGLYVQQQTTQPGGDNASFLIRGQSNFSSAGQAPLVLVDGAVRDFSQMDVQEIESISILKDASGLAWYGLRGGNGVVLVTTKRGNAGKTQITLDASGGVQQPDHFTKSLTAYDFAVLYNEAAANSGLPVKYDANALAAYQSGSDPYKYSNNDYVGRFLRAGAAVQRYVATLSGGNAVARYFTTASYYNQGGLFAGSKLDGYSTDIRFKRYNIRTNVDLRINKQLDVSLDLGIRSENRNTPEDGYQTLLSTIFTTPPNAFPVVNRDGTYGGTSIFQNNPLGMLKNRGFISNNQRVMFTTLQANQQLNNLLKGLSTHVYFANNISQVFNSGRTQNYEVYELKPDGITYNRYRTKAPLNYAASTFGNFDSRTEFWGGFSYQRSFARHAVQADMRYNQTLRKRPGALDDKTQGVSGRALYSFNNRYFVEGVLAYSGSQNFSPGNRFFWYPAISAGWVVSEESFLSCFKPINYLKIRGSWGATGNLGTIDRQFAYEDLWDRSTGGGPGFGTGFSGGQTATERPLGNPFIGGEKVEKINLGLDAKFLGQALEITVDYFREKRTRILVAAINPTIIGQSLINSNDGAAKYEGVEGSINYTRKLGKVNIAIFGNITFVKSKILSLNEVGLPAYQSQVGAPVTNKRVLIAEGIFADQAAINKSPVQQFSRTVAPGDIRYRDVNGDGFINNLDAVVTPKTDLPTSYYGAGFNVAYAGFDVSAFFQGVAGRTLDINSLINTGNNNNGYLTQFSIDRWAPGTAATASYPRLVISDRGNNTQPSTFWFRSGNYLRLKNVEIGYALPNQLIKKLKLTGCRVYVSGFDLLTHKNIKEDIDPEMPLAGFGSAYPFLKTYSMGLNIKL